MRRFSKIAKHKETTRESATVCSLTEKYEPRSVATYLKLTYYCSETPTKRFTNYEVLASNEIRLIELLPGVEDTTIQLHLVQNISLRETPP
jgi:hypothetical protein